MVGHPRGECDGRGSGLEVGRVQAGPSGVSRRKDAGEADLPSIVGSVVQGMTPDDDHRGGRVVEISRPKNIISRDEGGQGASRGGAVDFSDRKRRGAGEGCRAAEPTPPCASVLVWKILRVALVRLSTSRQRGIPHSTVLAARWSSKNVNISRPTGGPDSRCRLLSQ